MLFFGGFFCCLEKRTRDFAFWFFMSRKKRGGIMYGICHGRQRPNAMITNKQTVLPCGMNSTFALFNNFHCLSGLMHPWKQLILVLVCLRSRSSIIGPPSVVGRSVLSSEKFFIELLRFHAIVVLCCRLCRLCHIVKACC